MNIYPWNIVRWRSLLDHPESLPHALLLSGNAGLGKLDFAIAMATRLLCETPVSDAEGGACACGTCTSCVWMSVGNHPDFRRVQILVDDPESDADSLADAATSGTEAKSATVEKSGKTRSTKSAKKVSTISIQQIRALSDFIYLGSHRHGRRIVVLHPAEAMTPAAANAILKILEEPPASICFILVTNERRQLLPTIRSRCRSVLFSTPSFEQATNWLKEEGVADAEMLVPLAAGAPLRARAWAEGPFLEAYRKVVDVLANKPVDPVSMAARWAPLINEQDEFGLPQLVEAVQKWILDMTQWKVAGTLRYHQAWRTQLQELACKADLPALFACHADLLRVRAVVRHPLNTQLFLESLAAIYLRSVKIV